MTNVAGVHNEHNRCLCVQTRIQTPNVQTVTHYEMNKEFVIHRNAMTQQLCNQQQLGLTT